MRKKTNSEFVNEVNQLVGNSFIPLTSYNGNKVKVAFYHIDCGKVFYMSPNSFLRGQRCPGCGVISRTLKQTLTPKQFITRLKKKYGDRYTPLDKYRFVNSKMRVRCNWCNHTWRVTVNNLLRGYGCPYCSKHIVTEDMFKKRVAKKNNGQFVFLEPYKGIDTKIRCKCTKCGYEWRITPHAFYHIKGCPMCQTNHIYTTDEYNLKLHRKIGNSYTLLSKYRPSRKLKFIHNKCGHTFFANAGDMLVNNTGCPYCNDSKGEQAIEQILTSWGIKFETQYRFSDCKYRRTLPFDFYLPELHIAIEYDGSQHYQVNHFGRDTKSFALAKLRDSIKDWYCMTHGIFLIRIPYTVRSKHDIEVFLKSML